MLPKTIAWTLTAVPFRPVIRSIRRYSTALLPIQLLKTALMAIQSWSFGSCGKSLADVLLVDGLVPLDQLLEVVGR